jgi:hypothetical protein
MSTKDNSKKQHDQVQPLNVVNTMLSLQYNMLVGTSENVEKPNGSVNKGLVQNVAFVDDKYY